MKNTIKVPLVLLAIKNKRNIISTLVNDSSIILLSFVQMTWNSPKEACKCGISHPYIHATHNITLCVVEQEAEWLLQQLVQLILS